MKSFIANIICCSLLLMVAQAQHPISGKVLNDENDSPIEGATVYFNNTSLGTITSSNGSFFLPDAVNGELIVSSVGFERLIYTFNLAQLKGKSFTFKLSPKQELLQDVLILPDATRRKYLQLFQENFLGVTEEAASSKINNISSVYFVAAGTEKNSFKAMADTPLIIINNMLGYRIRFELVSFYLDQTTGQTSFYGYTRYEALGNKKRWVKNRENAYYGSTLHFFRSFIGDNLEAEKYALYIVRTDTIPPGPNETNRLPKKMDVAWGVKASDLVKKDSASDSYKVSWKHKLMVQYLKNPSGKSYLRSSRFLADGAQIGFRSYLQLLADSIQVDKYGIVIDPTLLYFSGYWVYEKAANLLPFNYYPEKK